MNAIAWLKNAKPGRSWQPESRAQPALATVPADLRQWVNESTLVGWVLETVCDALSGYSPGSARPENGPPVPTMLTVLIYCYATRRYGSDEIEAAAGTDRLIRYLCANSFVTSSAIRRFRRAHHALLHSCLASLHQRAWRHRFGLDQTCPEGAALLGGVGTAAQERFAYRLATAAEGRIQRAILEDTMEMDV